MQEEPLQIFILFTDHAKLEDAILKISRFAKKCFISYGYFGYSNQSNPSSLDKIIKRGFQ